MRPGYIMLGLLTWISMAACSETKFSEARTIASPEGPKPVLSEDATAERGSVGSSAPTEAVSPAEESPTAVATDIEKTQLPDSISRTFAALKEAQSSYSFNLTPKGASQNFTLKDKLSPRDEKADQIVRTATSDQFQQGYPGQPVNESIDQTARRGLVDILVVIDDSGSMTEEQKNLSTKLNDLLGAIKDSNWQISVITTNVRVPAGVNAQSAAAEGKEICLSTLIRYDEADAATKFAKAVAAGIKGSGNEQGVRQPVVGLRCTEKPWLRPTASLAVLIVSDEDNCSVDGKDCGSLPWAKETYLTNYIEKSLSREIGKNAGIYALISPSKALCATGGNVGTQYMRLVNYKANGATNYGNICDASYQNTLNRVSEKIALLLQQQFELKIQPDPGTFAVSLKLADGTEKALASDAYSLQGRVLSFAAGKEPPVGSKILARYTTGAKAKFSHVTLRQTPAAGTLSVKVNGNLLPASAYTLTGNQILFASMPADMAAIMVDYRINIPLSKRFKLAAVPAPGTLKALVDQKTASVSFDAATGEAVFAEEPLDGQAIAFSFIVNQGPELIYMLPTDMMGSNFRIRDAAGKDIRFTQADMNFTIDPIDFVLGKVLTLSYDIPDRAQRAFMLDHKPVLDKIKITSSAGAGCQLGAGITIEDQKLIISCEILVPTSFVISYAYETGALRYTMDGIEDPENGTWTVYVEEEKVSDFKREGSTIILGTEPRPEAKVTVQFSPLN